MCVGERIKLYLAESGISQTHVSNKSGIPIKKLNLALNGKRKINLDEYSAICDALNVPTGMFLRKEG